ncbi:hypothetical protein KKB3_01334 [Dehalococcoides mccartyi]|nr:hypothetical protein KKB3_01334 [Dehalococcoides mccartyi]
MLNNKLSKTQLEQKQLQEAKKQELLKQNKSRAQELLLSIHQALYSKSEVIRITEKN